MSDGRRCKVHLVNSISALKSLASEWEKLAALMGTPMLSHAWTLACTEAFCKEEELCIITVRSQGNLVGVAPLVRVKTAGGGRLELIGVSSLYEPSGLLYRNEEALSCLVRAMMGYGLPVVLARIPSDSPVIPQMRSVVSSPGMVIVGGMSYSLTVPVASGWEEYVAALSSRRRYDLRRARRRAEEAGPVAVRIFSPGPGEIDKGIAEFVRIESAGWKDRNSSSLRRREALKDFFQRYAALAAESGAFRFAFLDIEGTPVAAQLSAVYAGRFWVLKIGFDEAWSRCSPGWQLLAETMKYAFEAKLTSYEFLGSNEPWLHGWITESRSYRAVGCYPATLRGMCGLAVDTVDRIGARVAARLG